MVQVISDGKNKQSKPFNSPTTPIPFVKEKAGPSNPIGNTSAYSATELTASPMAGVFRLRIIETKIWLYIS
jgi:hypothetical protein